MNSIEHNSKIMVFGSFHFDPDTGELKKGVERQVLMPKDSEVLLYLLSSAGTLVQKEVLVKTVWKDTIVSSGVLKTCIKRIRKALGDEYRSPAFIETVPRRGYRFITPVTTTTKSRTQLYPDKSKLVIPFEDFIVGRNLEMKRLEGAWQKVSNEACQKNVMISGEAGIGKSSLTNCFVNQIVGNTDIVVARGQCINSQGRGEPYGPFLEILESLVIKFGKEEMTQLLREYAPMWLIQIPWLVSIEERKQLLAQLMGVSGKRMVRELVTLLKVISHKTPMVLIIEDLHWADEATVNGLCLLGKRTAAARILLISTHRSIEIYDHPSRQLLLELAADTSSEEIKLPLLTIEEVDQYLIYCFSDLIRPLKFAEWLHSCTDGNPLFLKALIAHGYDQNWFQQGGIVATGEFVEEGGAWTVPDSLRDLIDAQLRNLSDVVLRCLEAASVAGMTFSANILCDDPETEELQVEELLESLARSNCFIRFVGPKTWPDGSQSPCYTFTHAWYHQVTYDSIPMLRCQKLHLSIGARIEKYHRNQSHRIAAILANHFELGRNFTKAVTYRCLAGKIALERHAYGQVKKQIQQGLKLLDHIKDEQDRSRWSIELLIPLGNALIASEGYASKDVVSVYTQAHNLCQKMQSSIDLMPILHGLGIYYFAKGNFPEAERLVTQMAQSAELQKDPAHLIWVHALKCMLQWYQGDFQACITTADKGIAMYNPSEHQVLTQQYGLDGGMICLIHRATSLVIMGHLDQAEKEILSALAVAQTYASPFMLAWTLSFTGWTYLILGNYNKAEHLFKQCYKVSQQHDIEHWKAQAKVFQAAVWAKKGFVAKGLGQIRESVVAHRATGTKLIRGKYIYLLANAIGQNGEPGRALVKMEETFALVSELNERWWEAECHRLVGDLLIMQVDCGEADIEKNMEEAEASYSRALEVARLQGAKTFELRAAMALAELWTRQGKRSVARTLLADVYQWFTEGFKNRDLRDARVILDSFTK